MSITRDALRAKVIATLAEMRPGSDGTISDGTDPIAGLGLDSEDGLDFALRLSKKLNWRVPDNVNPFVDDDKGRSRTVVEIVEVLGGLMAKEAAHA